MAVVKKRRSHHAKSSRQAQLQQEQQNLLQQQLKDDEANRLKPEQMNSVVHDESDTISFRSNLLKNFLSSTYFMNVLTTQPIPISMIKPPRIFQSSNPVTLKTIIGTFEMKLSQEKNLLNELKERAKNLDLEESQIESCDKFNEDDLILDSLEKTDEVLSTYLNKYGLRKQDDRLFTHKQKFGHLKVDLSEAPTDYWSKTYKELVDEQKRKERLKKEEEERKKREEEERKKQEERKLLEEQKLKELRIQRKAEEQRSLQFQSNPLEKDTNVIDNIMIRQNEALPPNQIPQVIQASATMSSSSQPISLHESNELLTANTAATANNTAQVENVEANPQDNILEDMFTEYNSNDNEAFNNGFDDEFGDGFDNLDNVFF